MSERDRARAGWAMLSLLAASNLVAAASWLRVYSALGAAVAVGAAAVAPVGLASLCARVLRWRAPYSFACSAAGLVLTLVSASGFDPGALGQALLHGSRQLVTETLPLGGTVEAIPAIVAVWVAGAATGEIAVRAGRASYMSALSLAVPILTFVLAVGVAAPAPGRDVWVGPALVVTLAGAALTRHKWVQAAPDVPGHDRAPSVAGRRREVRAVLSVALLAVVLAAVVNAVPAIRDSPVSAYHPPAPETRLLVNPVAALGALRDSAPRHPRPLLRLTTFGRSDGYLTMAVLDRFDGSEWTFDSTFKPTGGRVPPSPSAQPAAVGWAEVKSSTTLLAALPVPLLPVLGRPAVVEGIRVAVDSDHGMVMPDQRLPTRASYTTVSLSPLVSLAGMASADALGVSAPGTVPGPNSETADLEIPPDSTSAIGTAVRFLAAISGSRPSATLAFLQRAMTALALEERRLDPSLGSTPAGGGREGGTSLSEVINAVTVNRSATPEQFATFFALVARYLGVPARLVTGFRLQPDQDVAGLEPGTYTVSERQAWTWLEVPVAGMGWVVADPTPAATTGVVAPPPEQVQVPPSTLPGPRANAVPREEPGGHAVAKPVRLRRQTVSGSPAWELAVAATVGLVTAGLFAGPVLAAIRRRLRRNRRLSADPALLAGGAWLELLDSFRRAGMDIPDGSTTTELSVEAGRHFGRGVAPQVMTVGAVADRAMCSVLDPPEHAVALDAWEVQRAVRRDIFRTLDRRQLARALLATGSRSARTKRAHEASART